MMIRSPDRLGAVSADPRRDGVPARCAGVVFGFDDARAVAFFAVALFAVAFFAVAFFAVAFFALAFFAVAFFAVAFFAVAFFALAFFALAFFAVAFFAVMVFSRSPVLALSRDYILQGRFGQGQSQRGTLGLPRAACRCGGFSGALQGDHGPGNRAEQMR
jgi:hypothetical protein